MVCVKKMEKDKVSLQGVKSEAAILCALNTGGFTPHCFGVCLSLHAVVMSYVSVSSRPVTIFSLLGFCSPSYKRALHQHSYKLM